MKKFIWIILLVIPLCHVQAENYYSDYSEWKEVSEIPNLNSDLFEVKEDKEYLWYRLEKEGSFFKTGEEHLEYPLPTDIRTFTDWSIWDNQKPEMVEGREIKTRTVYYYQTMKPIYYIRISNIAPEELTFLDTHVYKDYKEISFNQQQEGTSLLYTLSVPCHVDELEISFIMMSTVPETKSFKIEFLYDLNEDNAMEISSSYQFQGPFYTSYRYKDLSPNHIVWNDVQMSLGKVEERIHQKVWPEEQYQYRDLMNYYEKENKIYGDYSITGSSEFPYQDTSTEKIVLKVRTREKLDMTKLISIQKYQSDMLDLKKQLNASIFEKNELLERQSALEFSKEEWRTQLEQANATIMALTNEKSQKIETGNSRETVQIKTNKQSMIVPVMLLLLLTILLAGFCRLKKSSNFVE